MDGNGSLSLIPFFNVKFLFPFSTSKFFFLSIVHLLSFNTPDFSKTHPFFYCIKADTPGSNTLVWFIDDRNAAVALTIEKIKTYSQFLLFIVVLLYKVTVTSSKYWTIIASRGNTGLGTFKPLVKTFSATDQFIILFCVCFCLKTPYLVYTVHSLILNSWLTPL